MSYKIALLYKSAAKTWYAQYPWTHAVTLTFRHEPRMEDYAEAMLKDWRLRIIKTERVQLAYMGVFNTLARAHIHLLMFGSNKDGKSLLDSPPDVLSNAWRYGRAEAKAIYSSAGAIGYFVDKNMPERHYESVKPFNRKLLERGAKYAASDLR